MSIFDFKRLDLFGIPDADKNFSLNAQSSDWGITTSGFQNSLAGDFMSYQRA